MTYWLKCLLVLTCVLLFFGVVKKLKFPGIPFDAELWQNDQQIAEGIRQPMADRIIATKMLDGKTRDEVIEILGQPTEINEESHDWHFVYYLGPERGFISIDDEWLRIRFSKDGVVEKYAIIPD